MEGHRQTEEGKGDFAFVERVLAGDQDAREEFAVRMVCTERCLAALNHRSGRPLQGADLDDSAQNVRILVWEKLATFNGWSTLETWVLGFCLREFQRAKRKRNKDRGRGPIDPEQPDAGPGASQVLDEGLDRYLRHLSKREAQVVELRVVYDQQFDEIARELPISTSSAKEYWSRALGKLSDVITEPTLR